MSEVTPLTITEVMDRFDAKWKEICRKEMEGHSSNRSLGDYMMDSVELRNPDREEAIRDLVVLVWNVFTNEVLTPVTLARVKHEVMMIIGRLQFVQHSEWQKKHVDAWVEQLRYCTEKGITDVPPQLLKVENPRNFINSPLREAAVKDILQLNWDNWMLRGKGPPCHRDIHREAFNVQTIVSVLSPKGLTDEDVELLKELNNQIAYATIDPHASVEVPKEDTTNPGS